MSTQLIGTPCYFAPEVIETEKFSVASDIYALGVTLVHLANGEAPFSADTNTYAKIINDIMNFKG